jgi:hypothetical protein
MNMHCLEHILLATSVAFEKDAITKAELVRVLRSLASLSHDYAPEGDEPADILKMNDEWHRRFGHLMNGGVEKAEEPEPDPDYLPALLAARPGLTREKALKMIKDSGG